jgi:uroporphyrinogen decarboxylase
MTGRERVLRSLDHCDVDRVPLFFRAEPALRDRLRAALSLRDDAALAARFSSDAVHVNPCWKSHNAPPAADGCFYDRFGSLWRSVRAGDVATEAVEKPVLAGASTVDDVDRVNWPGPDSLDLDACAASARAARQTGLAVYGGVWASVFTTSRSMLGEEEYFVAMAVYPELVEALVSRLAAFYLSANEAYLSACAEFLDIYYFGSDFGTQGSLFISPSMFRRFYAPHLAALAAQAHRHGLKVMYHTCGAVSPLIDDLVACGIDILDPVQVDAAGMSPEDLSRWKGRIAFHGGISTQTLLPNGTPEEVYATTQSTIAALGPLGLIVAPDQEVIGDVPVENIDAMVRAAKEFKL